MSTTSVLHYRFNDIVICNCWSPAGEPTAQLFSSTPTAIASPSQQITKKSTLPLGLWTTRQEVEDGLSQLPARRTNEALKTQIRYRKKVMRQPADKALFALSPKQPFSSTELKCNLLKLIAVLSSDGDRGHDPSASNSEHESDNEDVE